MDDVYHHLTVTFTAQMFSNRSPHFQHEVPFGDRPQPPPPPPNSNVVEKDPDEFSFVRLINLIYLDLNGFLKV